MEPILIALVVLLFIAFVFAGVRSIRFLVQRDIARHDRNNWRDMYHKLEKQHMELKRRAN